MENHRIYAEKISIDGDIVKNFYDAQAEKAIDPRGAVFLGNQDHAILEEKNAFTRDRIIPKLKINQNTRILDLGCGVGRIAEMVLPKCSFYCGVDFSKNMVEKARQLCAGLVDSNSFILHCMSITEAVSSGLKFLGGPFDVIILSGVLMYLNDEEVKQVIGSLPELLNKQSIVYWGDPVGLEKRLTLRDFPSKSFQADYSAIYRTAKEYMDFFDPLFRAGFSIMEQSYMPKFGETYTDTARYYMLIER